MLVKHGDGDEPGRRAQPGERFPRGVHHGAAAQRVDVDHPHAEPRRGEAGAGHGIGDIVVLEIEEHFEPGLLELLDQLRARGRIELLADLDAADRRVEPRSQRERVLSLPGSRARR